MRVKFYLNSLQGVDIDKMTDKQIRELIKAICIMLDVADKQAKIK